MGLTVGTQAQGYLGATRVVSGRDEPSFLRSHILLNILLFFCGGGGVEFEGYTQLILLCYFWLYARGSSLVALGTIWDVGNWNRLHARQAPYLLLVTSTYCFLKKIFFGSLGNTSGPQGLFLILCSGVTSGYPPETMCGTRDQTRSLSVLWAMQAPYFLYCLAIFMLPGTRIWFLCILTDFCYFLLCVCACLCVRVCVHLVVFILRGYVLSF